MQSAARLLRILKSSVGAVCLSETLHRVCVDAAGAMAWQSNVGGGWTNDHTSHWDRGTPPQRFEKIEDATFRDADKPDWHGKRRLARVAQANEAGDPGATITQGRVVPLSPARAHESTDNRRGAWPWEMPQTHWEAQARREHRTPAPPSSPRMAHGGSPARHVPAIEYQSHPWGYNTLETERIRLARLQADADATVRSKGGAVSSSRSARTTRSSRSARPDTATRAAQAEELAATRAAIAEMRLRLGVRPNTPPQVMPVPTPTDEPQIRALAQALDEDSGSGGGTTARMLRLARAAIKEEEEKEEQRVPMTPPTPRRPRDRRKGPNGKRLVKKETEPRAPRPKHDFSQRALPFLKRLNTYNDPKFNFPKQKTDVTKVNAALVGTRE